MRHYDKADIFRGDIAAGKSRAFYQLPQTVSVPRVYHLQTELHHGPVFVQQRHDVTNRSDCNKIQNFGKHRFRKSCFLLDQLCRLKSHAASRKFFERIHAARSLGIDKQAVCHCIRNIVMIRDYNLHPEAFGIFHLIGRNASAVNRYDHLKASACNLLDCLFIETISLFKS